MKLNDPSALAVQRWGKESSHQLNAWSINTGGQTGFWRLLPLLSSLVFSDRPDVILIQEVAVSADGWITVHSRFDALGFTAYYIEPLFEKKRIGGVAIAVKSCFHSQLFFADRWQHGQAIAVKIGNTLALLSYCSPRGAPSDWLHQLWRSWNWRGRWFWAGDWNQ